MSHGSDSTTVSTLQEFCEFFCLVEFEVLIAETMKSAILWDVTLYELLPDYMVSVTSQKIALSINLVLLYITAAVI